MLLPILLQKGFVSFSLAASILFNSNDVVLQNPMLPPSDMVSTVPSSSIIISSSTATTADVLPMSFQQYNTANDIPSSWYKEQKVIRGRVIKVIDGDTIRVRHAPLSTEGRDCKKPIADCSISVRLYAIDAPETAKRGNPGQPFAKEATEYTSNQVLDKVVRVKLLRKDQYDRVIGEVITPNNLDLSVSLAEKGLASLYTGGGREYDGHKEVLEKNIEMAKQMKLGIWSGKDGDFSDPSQYKREMKARNGN
mmetsp:Transcript_5191/g.7237  ORF Transcript_5191/g.7237 Transcript_5191/m.7237 type:complete len:251 (-) Transcript_5191:71-823(-)